MNVLISDANIFIDLIEGGLLEELFQLEQTIKTSDILFYEELEQNHADLLVKGLILVELVEDSMIYFESLLQKAEGPSTNDCFAMVTAWQEKCPLLTGDRALKELAESEKVEVKGTVWVVFEMLNQNVISLEHARTAFTKMKISKRRLPWRTIEKMLLEYDSR